MEFSVSFFFFPHLQNGTTIGLLGALGEIKYMKAHCKR